MVRIEGWRVLTLLFGLVFVGVVLTIAVFWIGVALIGLVGLGLLHLVYLPRVAGWLRVSVWVVVGLLLPVLAGLGWWVAGEPVGALWGVGAWAIGFGLPRVALGRLASRVRVAAARAGAGGVTLVGTACPRCGLVRYDGEACERCGAAALPEGRGVG